MQLHEQPDSELVRQIQSGDDAAFDELMRRYKRPVVNFIFRMLGNAQDADGHRPGRVRARLPESRYLPARNEVFHVAVRDGAQCRH